MIFLCSAVLLLPIAATLKGAIHFPGPHNGTADCNTALAAHKQSACEDAQGRLYIGSTGEFGSELIWALPAAYAAWRRGALASTRGCGAMAPFYWFSPNHTDDRKCTKAWNGEEFSDLHGGMHTTHTLPREYWWPPPLRAHYRRMGLPAFPSGGHFNSTRPLVILHNKHSIEWGKPAVNFFSVPLLAKLVATLVANELQSLYIRHAHVAGFDDTGSAETPFNDYEFLRAAIANGTAPGLMLLDDIAKANPGP